MSSLRHVGLIALSVLLSVGALAGAASASQPKLELTEWGAPVGTPYTGAQLQVYVSLGENGGKPAPFACFAGAKMSWKNFKPVIRMRTEGGLDNDECVTLPDFTPLDGYAISGSITRATFSWTGVVTVGAKLLVSEPGPCIYDFRHINATTPVPTAFAIVEGTAEGYLSPGSVVSCPLIQSVPLILFFAETLENRDVGVWAVT